MVDSVSAENQSSNDELSREQDSPDQAQQNTEDKPKRVVEATVHESSKRVVADTIHESKSKRPDRFSQTKSKLSALISKTSESIFPQASASDDFLGRVLNTKYGIKRIIKKDDFGIIYSGRDITNREKVIVKTPYYTEENVINNFKRMAEKKCALEHKNIVEYVDYFESSSGRPFLVSKYTIGIYLDDLIKEVEYIKTEFDFQNILYQLCDAIEYAHANDTIHGALEPSGIILEEREGEITLKLSGFESSEYKRAVLKHIEQEYEFEDLAYLTPEHLRNEEIVKASDLYSIGLISYFILTGKDAYTEHNRKDMVEAHLTESIKPTSLAEVRPNLHCVDDLNRIISECLDTDKDWRIQNIEDLKEEIDTWIKSEAKSIDLPDENLDSKPSSLSKEEQAGLKSTLHNLVSLKRHQVEQEETVIMKFTDAVAKSGPRQSPQKAMARLIITYVGGGLFLLLLATYSILNWDRIQTTFMEQSQNLSSIVKKEAPVEEDDELPPVEGADSLPPVKAGVNSKGSTNSANPKAATSKSGQVRRRSRRLKFKYSESPSYMQFIPKDNASKKEVIDPSQTSRFKKLPEH